ncbi:unnamed protein product, partial [Leptidea sinapis]
MHGSWDYELKRRLQDASIPLAKRFRLAKNVVYTDTHDFPSQTKEMLIGEWLGELTSTKSITSKQFRDVLGWLDGGDDFTVFKYELIKIVAKYVGNNIIQVEDIKHIITFLENSKIRTQLIIYIKDFIDISVTLLQHLAQPDSTNSALIDRLLKNISQYYKDCKKKLEFTILFLDGDILETIFGYLGTENEKTTLSLCQSILFPMNKKSYFAGYLNNLIRKADLSQLIEESGSNIVFVLKIMDAFLKFPEGRTNTDESFLKNFISVFVYSYSNESQLIFAFYIMLCNCLDLKQNYVNSAMKLTPIEFDSDKIKRGIFLHMLEVLVKNEIDISIQLRDTINDRSAETIKTFLLFLQDVLFNNIKVGKKVNKMTLNLITTALKLDPTLVEQVTIQILPLLMVAKKNSSTMSLYIEMINLLLKTMFKLGRGLHFIHEMLPHLKNTLDLNQSEHELDGSDLLPDDCVDIYGRLTSELLFRQNKDLLLLFQEDLEEYCLKHLQIGNINNSVTVLTEMLSAILSSFLRYNKMADHSVPLPIGEDFWSAFHNFENGTLKTLAECLAQLDYNTRIVSAFLKTCICFVELKVLNFKFSNIKLDISEVDNNDDIFDMGVILPSLKNSFKGLVPKINVDENDLMQNLLVLKRLAFQLVTKTKKTEYYASTFKSHVVKTLSSTLSCDKKSYYLSILFSNLDQNQVKQVAKCLVKTFSEDGNIFLIDAVANNKHLLQASFSEATKNILKQFENTEPLLKCLKESHDISTVLKENSGMKLLYKLTITEKDEKIAHYLDIVKHLQLYYLDENSQLVAILVLLALKNNCNVKENKRSIDNTLQSIYEVSTKLPDVFILFSVSEMFQFDNNFFDLLKLNTKASKLIIVKSLLETAVKKVKTDAEVIKNIVKILLAKLPKVSTKLVDIEYFANPIFQIICILLPILTKEKRNITTSAYRSILANLQEQLNKIMLDSFKNIDFSVIKHFDVSEDVMATLNAMNAYSLTLLKCCETNDGSEVKSTESLYSGLDFFVKNALQIIGDDQFKAAHVETPLQLINIMLRYKKKLEWHQMVQDSDKFNEFLSQVWRAIKLRLSIVHGHRVKITNSVTDEMVVTLKYVAELSSTQFFVNIVDDLNALCVLMANIVELKCEALAKLMFRSLKNMRFWIQQHFSGDFEHRDGDKQDGGMIVTLDDSICEILTIDLSILAEVILAAKKISFDYKFLDVIFVLQHQTHYILGRDSTHKCDISWKSFFALFESSVAILNSLIQSREELLEDRWPCFMQCYKTLVLCMCERSKLSDPDDRTTEHKFAEIAHSIEKNIAAYAVADFCVYLESCHPPKIIRQHLENSVVLLIQACDSTHSMAFLRRGLAGAVGQMTLTNMYTMYKRYHKYVGNA